jgi:sodium/potassium-transporting ATPase subunit alpha
VILFVAGFGIGYPAILNFVFAIGVITANVPEGLIVEITICLSLTAQLLSQRKVLVKYLDAVETLGATSCICSDKTGTLTQNKMTASHLWFSGKLCKAENRQKRGPDYNYDYDPRDPGFRSLQEVAVVCSVAAFDRTLPSDKRANVENDDTLTPQEREEQVKQMEVEWADRLQHMLYLDMPTTGDASESGLIKFFQPISDVLEMRAGFPVARDNEGRECRLPFNSTNKYAFSVNEYPTEDSHYCLFVKGAPERIWKLCDYLDIEGHPQPKTQEWEDKFLSANNSFGQNGERVLGFAKLHLPKDRFPLGHNFNVDDGSLLKGLCFVGVLSLSDPPRDTVPPALIKCKSAGIKVIMVTGDQPVTAASIAKLCNIITEETVNEIAERTGRSKEECFEESNAIVIHGDELTQMALEDEGLPESEQGKKLEKWLSKSQIVFARTSPAQKLVIVKGCQKIGEVVAVTGDGVNDSPAIKKADIGVSMGITGTDVAQDAADMILVNDDFSSIVVGIEQGRKIYDNIKKSICYALTSQVGQMLPFIAFIVLQIPSPVTTVIVLYISIGTDLIPDIALAYELGELDLMTRRPRNKEEHMVTLTLMAQAYGYMGWIEFWGAMLCYFVIFNDFGFPPAQLIGVANTNMTKSNPGDQYNPTHPTFGNSYLFDNFYTQGVCPSTSDGNTQMVDWISTNSADHDLRMTMLDCSVSSGTVTFTQKIKWGECIVQQISPFTNKPVCYTTEAAKYAQGGYFIAIVLCQIFNIFACKTRKSSILNQGASNTFLFFALSTEAMLLFAVTYFEPFYIAFGLRDNIFMHFGIPALPFGILQILIDELRKYLIRSLPADDKGKPHWFSRAALW